MNKALLSLAALSVLVLAGCDNAPDKDAAVTVQTPPPASDTTTIEIQVPEALAPAAAALANPQQTIDDLRSRAATMSEQMKQDAVVAARRAAEDGARALGHTEPQIIEAGNVAERTTRQAVGLQ